MYNYKSLGIFKVPALKQAFNPLKIAKIQPIFDNKPQCDGGRQISSG